MALIKQYIQWENDDLVLKRNLNQLDNENAFK